MYSTCVLYMPMALLCTHKRTARSRFEVHNVTLAKCVTQIAAHRTVAAFSNTPSNRSTLCRCRRQCRLVAVLVVIILAGVPQYACALSKCVDMLVEHNLNIE